MLGAVTRIDEYGIYVYSFIYGSYTLLHSYPPGNQLLGTSFQEARRAFWGEARPGFGVHWCVYTNGHRSPGGLRDARKGIGVQ